MSLHSYPEGYQEEIRSKMETGNYFGQTGAVAFISTKCKENHNRSPAERASWELTLASILCKAATECFEQLKCFRALYLVYGINILMHRDKILSDILHNGLDKEFNTLQKEVLMEVLLVCRYANPLKFFRYRTLAIQVGRDLLVANECSDATHLLVLAHLSRLWFYPEAKHHKKTISDNISNALIREEIGLNTTHRLAILIGNKKIARHCAERLESKEGVYVRARMGRIGLD